MKSIYTRVITPAILIACLSAPQALAQDEVSVDADETRRLTPVTVTALKQEQSILEVPIAISAYEGPALEEIGADSLRDIVSLTPGVSIFENRPGSNLVQIRGISSFVGDATVGYYLDDLPFTLVGQNFQPDLNPFDLERVEILRGPQGTLYGAGSQGGTIRVLTSNADPSEFSGKARAFVETVDGGDSASGFQGAVNIPIVEDKFAVRFSAGVSDEGGFVDNSLLGLENVNSFDREEYRAKFTLNATERLQIRGSYWYNLGESGGENQSTVDFDRAVAIPESNRTEYSLYSGVLEYEGDNFDVYSSTSYIDFENKVEDSTLGGVGAPLRFDIPFESTSINHETRISNTDGSFFDWQLGIFYLDSETEQGFTLQADIGGGTLFPTALLDEVLTSEQIAVFGESYFNFDNGLTATIGLRYSEDERSRENTLPGSIATLAAFGFGPIRETSFEGVSPRFNLNYQVSDNYSVYTNIARGSRGGLLQGPFGIAASLEGAAIVDEEQVWSYEAGSKFISSDGNLIAEAAVYYLEWDDVQFTISEIIDIFGTPTLISYVNNVAGATGYGFEGAVSYAATDELTFGFNGSWNDTEYDGAIPGITTGPERVQVVPELSLVGTIDYRRPFGSKGAEIYANASASYTSERPDYTFGTTTEGDAITIINARIGLDKEKWGIALYAENLGNEDGAYFNTLLVPLQGRPRPTTFGVQLDAKF